MTWNSLSSSSFDQSRRRELWTRRQLCLRSLRGGRESQLPLRVGRLGATAGVSVSVDKGTRVES